MRKVARSIIVRDGKLLVIKRKKQGKTFFVLPGGGIDEGETAEQAAVREVLEEASVKSKVVRKAYQEEVIEFGQTDYFISDYVSGEPKLDPDSTEAEVMEKENDNTWNPMWIDISEISRVRFLPIPLTKQLIHDLEFGFSPETGIIKAKKEEF